jgi:hypothetical protein
MGMPWKLSVIQFFAILAVFIFMFRPAFDASPLWMQGLINTAIFYYIARVGFPALHQGWEIGKIVAEKYLAKKEVGKNGRPEKTSDDAEPDETAAERRTTKSH